MNRVVAAQKLVKMAKSLMADNQTTEKAFDIVDEIFVQHGKSGGGWSNLEFALKNLTTEYPDIPAEEFHVALWMKRKSLENQMKAVEVGLRWAKK